MSTVTEIADAALKLSPDERISLATQILESVQVGDLPVYSAEELDAELKQRASEPVDDRWLSHDQFMAEARRQLRCSN